MTPILEKQLKKGARVVAHDFEFSAWASSEDHGSRRRRSRSHTLRLYQR
ncbi:MAG: hypothetical protein WDO18_19040 [Acidobacteriota bacterium]